MSNNYIPPSPVGYNIRNQKGDINTKRFINTLDYSLELIKLRDVYQKTYRRINFSFKINDKEFTQQVINITFKYSVKEWNKMYGNIYVKCGYSLNDIDLQDCVCFKGGELIAVQVDSPVNNSRISESDNYFYLEDGVYKAKKNIKTLMSIADLRTYLYENGFMCDGIKYVRFKRSSGSSRVGKCLFINETLYRKMHRWELCGLQVNKGQEIDLAGFESYISLTLSSIIGTLELQPKNILVIDDYESKFYDDVVVVKDGDDGLEAHEDRIEISNSIWDGQSLIDKSAMGEYSEYGFVLLRNRFFKSACFNTNLQEWFADKEIYDINQLKGFTLATDVKDIKLITTPSSIKYLKFKSLKDWLDNLDSLFGVVKHDKKTHFFDGRMVQTHYQLLNTLQLSKEEVQQLIQPSLDYISLIKTNPSVLRYHINYIDNDYEYSTMKTKNDMIYRFLGHNEKFVETKLYNDFRTDLIKSMTKNLRCGHVLVSGNYSTMLGNPVEMLQFTIGKFNGESQIGVGKIHSTRFDYGVDVLGSRSPHVTAGNVWVTNNSDNADIDEYFNLTPEIVCVNSINENLLARLSGCDFDSDSVLLTDNQILLNAAKRNYHKFKVPTGNVSAKKLERTYTQHQQADLDIKTSVNKIGEIINLSQELNTLLWDRVNSGKTIESQQVLYNDIALLDVLSNLEIDKAKREYNVDSVFEIKRIKQKYSQLHKDDRTIKPNFFAPIAKSKGYYDNKRKYYKLHKTTMDYLQQCINKFRSPKAEQIFCSFSALLEFEDFNVKSVCYDKVENIVDMITQCKSQINSIWNDGGQLEKSEKYHSSLEIKKQCQEYINSAKLNLSTMYYLLKIIELPKYSTIKNMLFEFLLSSTQSGFYDMVKKSKEQIPTLIEIEDGTIKIYDYHFDILETKQ